MPTTDPAANQAYCRAYYHRLKQSPAKYADRLAKIREARQRRSSRSPSPCAPLTASSSAAPDPMPVDRKQFLPKDAASECFQERAAIMQFDGGLSQASAEARALADLLAHYTLEDLPAG